jgi:signal transduction histidine kinase
MPDAPPRRWRWWPGSLLGRLTLVMVAGVLATQLAGNLIWAVQLRAKSRQDAQAAAHYLGQSAANTIRFFRSLPPNYRPILIRQFRDMGGMRFFANLGPQEVPIQAIAPQPLAELAKQAVRDTLKAELPQLSTFHLAFAWPDQLAISADGVKVTELPDSWVQHILLVQPDPAPVLVIQTELEPGHWLYLASLMPNPYFLNGSDPLSPERLLLPGLTLAVALVLTLLAMLRGITRPLARLSRAAQAFGQEDDRTPELPETGSREIVHLVQAFNAMRQRIQKYIADRERLFVSISHDLRTPITRLKLRSELLDDDALRAEFEEDLDELDMMVKGALQTVKDSDIHENAADVRLDALLQRLVRGAHLAGHEVACAPTGLTVRAKPLALKRALGNLLDNALFYGERVEIGAQAEPGWVLIRIRDHGPGVPEDALASLFEPKVRLQHGREHNEGGLGLGLGIARSIIQAQGGQLVLANLPEGGLVASVRLPQPAPAG